MEEKKKEKNRICICLSLSLEQMDLLNYVQQDLESRFDGIRFTRTSTINKLLWDYIKSFGLVEDFCIYAGIEKKDEISDKQMKLPF